MLTVFFFFISELNEDKGDTLLNNCKYKCFTEVIKGHGAYIFSVHMFFIPEIQVEK